MNEDEEDHCSECGASFIGDPIPLVNRHMYGGNTHFRNIVGMEYPWVYDGVLFWMCPSCDFAFPREFPGSLHRAAKSVEEVNLWNESRATTTA